MTLKIFGAAVALVSICIIMATPAVSAATEAQTLITGKVFYNNKPDKNARVIVKCTRYWSDTAYTNEHGEFLMRYPVRECGWGSTLRVWADNDFGFGFVEGMVHKVTPKFNLGYVIVPIPWHD